MMVVAPICSVVVYKDLVHPTTKSVTHGEKGLINDTFPVQKLFQCFRLSNAQKYGRRWCAVQHGIKPCSNGKGEQKYGIFSMVHHRNDLPPKKITGATHHMVDTIEQDVKSTSENISQLDKLCPVSDASVSDNIGGQLKTLDSYFSKLHKDTDEQPLSCMSETDLETATETEELQRKFSSALGGKITGNVDKGGPFNTKMRLDSLENYFDKLNAGAWTQNIKSETFNEERRETGLIKPPNFISEEYPEDGQMSEKLNSSTSLESIDDNMVPALFGDKSDKVLQPHDEASDFFLINFLVAIDVAVFLFEIASPVGKPDLEQLSLPLVYGAKINKLILDGEWWRLVTPMFLHSGFLHVVFSCWVLLTFGPQVCRGYGPFAFFLIYILGGICANITSFVHTPELTVGGTGPVFAIIGAWLVYQFQNKEAIPQEISDNMYWKAVIATAMGFVLSSSGRIDEWTHLGAAFSGILYGFFTCPAMQLDNLSPGKGQKEGMGIVGRQADPLKSVLIFIIFMLALCPLVYIFEPELDASELDTFL